MLGGLLALGGLVGAGVALTRMWSLGRAARELDRRFDLRDRLTNALAFQSSPDAFADLAIRDAERIAAPLRAAAVIHPARALNTRAWYLLILGIGAGMGVGLWLPTVAWNDPQPTRAQKPTPETLSQVREIVRDSTAAAGRDPTPTPAHDAAIAELERELSAGTLDDASVRAKAAAIAEDTASRLEDEARSTQAQSDDIKSRMARAAEQSQDSGSELANALRRADAAAASDAARKLAQDLPRLSAAEREALANELDSLDQALSQEPSSDLPATQDLSGSPPPQPTDARQGARDGEAGRPRTDQTSIPPSEAKPGDPAPKQPNPSQKPSETPPPRETPTPSAQPSPDQPTSPETQPQPSREKTGDNKPSEPNPSEGTDPSSQDQRGQKPPQNPRTQGEDAASKPETQPAADREPSKGEKQGSTPDRQRQALRDALREAREQLKQEGDSQRGEQTPDAMNEPSAPKPDTTNPSGAQSRQPQPKPDSTQPTQRPNQGTPKPAPSSDPQSPSPGEKPVESPQNQPAPSNPPSTQPQSPAGEKDSQTKPSQSPDSTPQPDGQPRPGEQGQQSPDNAPQPHQDPKPGENPQSGQPDKPKPGETSTPPRPGFERLAEELKKFAEQEKGNKRSLKDSRKLREQAERLLDSMSPDEKRELERLAREFAKENPDLAPKPGQAPEVNGESENPPQPAEPPDAPNGDSPNANHGQTQPPDSQANGNEKSDPRNRPRSDTSRESRSTGPRPEITPPRDPHPGEGSGPSIPPRDRPLNSEDSTPVDARSISPEERPIAEWASQPGVPGAPATRGEYAPVMRRAAESAHRAIEQRAVPPQYSDLVRRVFRRYVERAPQ